MRPSRTVTYVIHVIPVVQPPEAIAATSTWDTRDLVIIDNTTLGLWRDICKERSWAHVTMLRNLGVATSWNLGARWAFQDGADYVSLVSSSVCWNRGLTAWTKCVEEGADERGLLTDLAFHASAWHRSVFDRIGWFDENFYPAYMEDIDWLRRLEIAGLHVPPDRADAVGQPANVMPKAMLDEQGSATCENALSLKSGAVTVSFARSERYYVSKWLGTKHEEQTDRPFGMYVPISWWPVLREV